MNETKVMKLRALHTKEKPLMIYHIWSVESARALQRHTPVLATGSYAMSEHYGYEDGENMPFQDILDYVKEMIQEDTIVIVDIESGYAQNIAQLKNNIAQLLDIGVSGINIEDKISGTEELYSIEEQCERIKAIKEVAALSNKDIFVNLRTDLYFTGGIQSNNNSEELFLHAVDRIKAYTESGCDGIFIPGLKNKDIIAKLAQLTTLPLDIMLDFENDDINSYLELGVSRICSGPSLFFMYNKSNNASLNDFFDTLFSNNIISQ